jgi:membrane associated rhomboid family serine protease
MRNITPTVKALIAINVALLLLTQLLERTGVDLVRYLALFYPASPYFMPHQFITHLFMHGGWTHLFFNMYALWLFGSVLEQVWGQKRFLIYYFVTGLGAAALHTFVNWIELSKVPQAAIGATVGASGAIFGVLLAFGMLFPNTRLMLLFPPIPIKAKWLVVGYGAVELALGFYNPGSNVAHFAHVGGMVFGFFLIKYWQKRTTYFY